MLNLERALHTKPNEHSFPFHCDGLSPKSERTLETIPNLPRLNLNPKKHSLYLTVMG